MINADYEETLKERLLIQLGERRYIGANLYCIYRGELYLHISILILKNTYLILPRVIS